MIGARSNACMCALTVLLMTDGATTSTYVVESLVLAALSFVALPILARSMYARLFGSAELSENEKPRVVIVGGSFAGLQCAMGLARNKNIHITVLEKKVFSACTVDFMV